jgi:ComF family protein
MGSFGRSFIDFFFPPQCSICGKPLGQNPLDRPCPSCVSQLKVFFHPRCPRCGRGFDSPIGEDHLCSACLTEDWVFAKARAVGPYEGWMIEVISRFKFLGVARLAKPLGTLLAEYRDAAFSFSEYDLLLSVPLHPQRLRQRGFNQSLLLARRIARIHSLAIDATALQRVRHTQPQTELSGPERKANIRHAFAVKKRAKVCEKRILLIDDVFTTGATVQECAKILLKAGAKQVDVLTLARVL